MTQRLDAIRGYLYAHGFSTVQTLAEAVGASLATIRRDLQLLDPACERLVFRIRGQHDGEQRHAPDGGRRPGEHRCRPPRPRGARSDGGRTPYLGPRWPGMAGLNR